jgi:hypothetical protein
MRPSRNYSWLETGGTKPIDPMRSRIFVGMRFHAPYMNEVTEWEVVRARGDRYTVRLMGDTITKILDHSEIRRCLLESAFRTRDLDLGATVIGLTFGSAAVTEHEGGIASLRADFGLDGTKIGVERRLIRAVPSRFEWVSYANGVKGFAYEGPVPSMGLTGAPRFPGDMYVAWDDESFAAYARTTGDQARLRELYDAIHNQDGAMWMGHTGPFLGDGLVLGIASRIPAEIVEAWAKTDDEHAQLNREFKATGIEEKLRAAGKNWFALTPRRHEDGSLVFWLNPMDQIKHEMGLYSLADLEAWIRGEGPVMKKPAPPAVEEPSRRRRSRS